MAKSFNKKLNNHFLFPLILIFVVGLFLYFLFLGKYPVGFHSQEALLGYRGKLLSEILTDETGRKLPLVFTSFEGYQWPISSYLVAASIKLFGLKEWAVRLPFAVFGFLGLLSFYFICRNLFFKNKELCFWATLVFAISPWQVFLSRTTSSWVLLFNIFLLFFWLFLALRKRKKIKIIMTIAVIMFLLVISWSSFYFQTPGAKENFLTEHLGFFTNPTIINSINQMRGESLQEGNPFLGKLFYNKSFYLIELGAQFLDHLNPRLYFIAGDSNPLHGLSNFGPVLFIFLPFFLAGFWFLFQKNELSKKKWLFLIWFLLGVIPSVLSYPSPNQEKLIFVFPVLAILTGYSLARFKNVFRYLFILFLIFNIGVVFYDAIYREPFRAQKKWQYGVKDLVELVDDKKVNFDKIFYSDAYSPDLGPQLLFYLDYPSEQFKEKGLFYHRWLSMFDNITIGQSDTWAVAPSENPLFIITPMEEKIINNYRILGEDNKLSDKVCYKITDKILNLKGEPIYLVAEKISDNCLLKQSKGSSK